MFSSEKLLAIRIWCGSMGAFDCMSASLRTTHRMVILAGVVGLGHDNPERVVSTIKFLPSAWDP